MLFDLKGRRRRVVQVTYLLLAFLMGGGLVLTGIGSDAPGGLLDAVLDRSGTSSGNSLVQDRIEENEDKLDANPSDKAALKALVRDRFQLANDEANPNTNEYNDDGKEHLEKADDAWKRYLEVEKRKPDASLASVMIQVYGPGALDQASDATRAAEIITEAQPTFENYYRLVQFAARAGQKRKADLAGQKAVELAPKNQRSTVKRLVEEAKQPAPSTTPPSP